MYVDTHAHLNFKAFKKDWREVADRAEAAGVSVIINVGSGLENSRRAVQMAREDERLFAACGLHPIAVDDEAFRRDEFEQLARDARVVAVGETGFDYFHKSDRGRQEEAFAFGLELAREVGKPVILHSRQAEERVLSFLDAHGGADVADPPGVLHCYSGPPKIAEGFLERGFYLSFTGNITYKLSSDTKEVLKEAPLSRIMIETDCPYLAPVPFRGKRNEPARVVKVAEKLAEIKGVTLGEVAEATTANARRLFGFEGPVGVD